MTYLYNEDCTEETLTKTHTTKGEIYLENMMTINRDNYSEFIKSEKELKLMLGLSGDSEHVNNVLHALENYLQINKVSGDLENFNIKENRLEIETSRYIIYMLVLHNGDVCQYTVNKRTKKSANYSRRMRFTSVIDTLNNFLG